MLQTTRRGASLRQVPGAIASVASARSALPPVKRKTANLHLVFHCSVKRAHASIAFSQVDSMKTKTIGQRNLTRGCIATAHESFKRLNPGNFSDRDMG